jgi:hypothetical protein
VTTDMLSWLRQQIEARKALAEEAHGASWAMLDQLVERLDGGADDRAVLVDDDDRTELIGVTLPGSGLDEDDLAHIAFNDPRQIIADCGTDLEIADLHGRDAMDACRACCGYFPCLTLLAVVSRYRNRPGYLPEWSPERTTP